MRGVDQPAQERYATSRLLAYTTTSVLAQVAHERGGPGTWVPLVPARNPTQIAGLTLNQRPARPGPLALLRAEAG